MYVHCCSLQYRRRLAGNAIVAWSSYLTLRTRSVRRADGCHDAISFAPCMVCNGNLLLLTNAHVSTIVVSICTTGSTSNSEWSGVEPLALLKNPVIPSSFQKHEVIEHCVPFSKTTTSKAPAVPSPADPTLLCFYIPCRSDRELGRRTSKPTTTTTTTPPLPQARLSSPSRKTSRRRKKSSRRTQKG